MDIYNLLECNGLTFELLKSFSFRSELGLSLKNSLRHFDKEKILEECYAYADLLDSNALLYDTSLDYRIKSYESIKNKFERYYPNKEAYKAFNDILGFRAFCDDYSLLRNINNSDFEIADMSLGKAKDDGYRGIHIYYKASNFHYPIEIQFNTFYDRQMNNWLHDYIYKKDYDTESGAYLRKLYEAGEITDLQTFKEVLINDIFDCKK